MNRLQLQRKLNEISNRLIFNGFIINDIFNPIFPR